MNILPVVISVKKEVAPTGAWSTFEFGRIFWGKPIACSTWLGSKKNAEGTLLCMLMFKFWSLKTERSGRPRNAACLDRGIDNRMRRMRQPCRVQRISRPCLFMSKATHVFYASHSLDDVLVRVLLISPKSHARWKKKKSQDNKKNNQQHKKAAFRTTSTERCAPRTVAARISPACIQ